MPLSVFEPVVRETGLSLNFSWRQLNQGVIFQLGSTMSKQGNWDADRPPPMSIADINYDVILGWRRRAADGTTAKVRPLTPQPRSPLLARGDL